ncbi:hypothetical protein MnTg04_01536 [bacterium MnTg04]|nr:hypothetical protein MnTg04_01536 [bacterium MnTg04]
MISASPDRFDSLQLIQLTLSLLKKQDAVIPLELQEAFMSILGQARDLIHDPHAAMVGNVDLKPEAIALALMMKREADLADSIELITTFDDIEPQTVDSVLSYIESRVAS